MGLLPSWLTVRSSKVGVICFGRVGQSWLCRGCREGLKAEEVWAGSGEQGQGLAAAGCPGAHPAACPRALARHMCCPSLFLRVFLRRLLAARGRGVYDINTKLAFFPRGT